MSFVTVTYVSDVCGSIRVVHLRLVVVIVNKCDP